MSSTVTAAQIDCLRLYADACRANGIQPALFRHRLPEGTVTANTNGPSPGAQRNKSFVQSTAYRPDDVTTEDAWVWAEWEPQELRVGVKDAGDSPVFGAWMQRGKGQMCALDTNGNPVNIADEDWLVMPGGSLFRLENPVISPDGCWWLYEAWTQR